MVSRTIPRIHLIMAALIKRLSRRDEPNYETLMKGTLEDCVLFCVESREGRGIEVLSRSSCSLNYNYVLCVLLFLPVLDLIMKFV